MCSYICLLICSDNYNHLSLSTFPCTYSEMLREKRKEAHDLSLHLNRTKQAIDQAKQRLEQREQSRGS